MGFGPRVARATDTFFCCAGVSSIMSLGYLSWPSGSRFQRHRIRDTSPLFPSVRPVQGLDLALLRLVFRQVVRASVRFHPLMCGFSVFPNSLVRWLFLSFKDRSFVTGHKLYLWASVSLPHGSVFILVPSPLIAVALQCSVKSGDTEPPLFLLAPHDRFSCGRSSMTLFKC